MDTCNKTVVTKFVLVGFTGGPVLQIALFIILALLYIITLLGNGIMMVIIFANQRLHTPMYFFLWVLSMLETLNISNIVPLMLVQVFALHTSISVTLCFMQSFFYVYLTTNAFLLISFMSYDRYVAICKPLHYTAIMTAQLCIQLVIGSWLASFVFMLYPTIVITRLPFCGPNIIDHFFCDTSAILKLACGNTMAIQLEGIISALIILPSSLGLNVVSYVFIISTILRIPSENGRRKTFSTCSSHLIMVSICYGSAIFIQVSPALNTSMEVYKAVNMFSTIISPLVNPFVYTFRNEQVKQVLKKYIDLKIPCPLYQRICL